MNENKIKNTKVGDDIHFFVNGAEDRGIVVKMNNEYVTVFKESTQNYDDIHINDTFFIKDILINKEWDKMEDTERFELLKSIHAPTPRFLSKSWDQLPKEIKTLLTKNNGIETSHKEDEDSMDTTVRTFDKTLNQTSRGKPKQRTRGGVKTTVGDDEDSGIKEEPKGFSTSGEKQEGLTHNVANFDEFKTIEEEKLGEGSKGDKNVTGIDYKVEGGDGIGVGAELSGQERAQRQSDLHQGKRLANEEQKKIQERKERKENTNTEVPEKVTEGVSALKAWQLWLAKREQQVLKDSVTGEQSIAGNPQGELGQSHSEQAQSEKLRELWGIRAGDDPKKRGETKIHIGRDTPETHSNQPAGVGEKTGSTWDVLDPKRQGEREENYDEKTRPSSGSGSPKAIKRSISEMMEELKSSVETSIHGNAARNPNSGVNTNTSFDASNDYEGFTHDGIRLEQFKHEKKKPKVGKEKGSINVDGKEKPADSTQGTGDNGNAYNTATQNKTDKKGRIVSEKDKK